MEKRKSVGVVKMNPLTHYFQKTREVEDRNESDEEEEDEEEDGVLNEVVEEGMDEPGPSKREGEGDAGGSRGTVAVKLYKYNPQWENMFKVVGV